METIYQYKTSENRFGIVRAENIFDASEKLNEYYDLAVVVITEIKEMPQFDIVEFK